MIALRARWPAVAVVLVAVVAGAVAWADAPFRGEAEGEAGGPSSSLASSAAPPFSSPAPTATPRPTASEAAVLVGAGDVAQCERPAARETAALVATIPGTVFIAGDVAYDKGTTQEFRDCYAPTWGAFQDRTLPAVGNHEYKTPGATGYYGWFGQSAGTAGEGWYAATVGTWRVIVLNAECSEIGGCGEGSPELTWLRIELAAHPSRCTVAIWHEPRWSSGLHGDDPAVAPFWDALYAAGAELVVNGHDHDYERFAPQDPSGRSDPARGIREFVVGTGGASLRPLVRHASNSEVADAETHGVLRLDLHPGGYGWTFVPIAGGSFTDSGSGGCH